MQESREQIKTRMLKNAAKTWGYAETEPESSFDPLVSMLLTACSIELEKISGEIHNSRARVLERLVQLLSPDAFTGALPAHAVVTAMPVERQLQLAQDDQYYITRKVQTGAENEEPVSKDIFFSPSGSFRLNNASIKFMAAGSSLYRINNSINKELISQADTGKSLAENTLWLAIDEPAVSLKNTHFYFDLRNDAARQLFYHQLPKASWYWNDAIIPHAAGFAEADSGVEQLVEQALGRNDDVSGKIKKQVNAFYKPFFITLLDGNDIAVSEDNRLLWGMIDETFSAKAAQALLHIQPLRWLCIDFPETVSSQVLDDVVCVMNSFPVMNRKLHLLTHRMQELVNIIPLQTDDVFLDMDEASNDEGRLLNNRGASQQQAPDNFSVLLRNGGVARFDERDATAIVDYVVQLLRDESVSFASLGNDFMNREMKQVQQIMNRLEQRLFTSQQIKGQVPYLIVRNNEKMPWQTLFLKYWSTCGMQANHIKAGNALRLYKGSHIHNNVAVLVTSTIGGRNRLDAADSILAYKSAVLSRDRLVSVEDIKAFCNYQLGTRVKKIVVEKGIMVHPDEQAGFVKTLDVKINIEAREFNRMNEIGEIGFWRDNLKIMLEDRSVTIFPFRVYIEQSA